MGTVSIHVTHICEVHEYLRKTHYSGFSRENRTHRRETTCMHFKELAHISMESGKSKICSWLPGDAGELRVFSSSLSLKAREPGGPMV